MEIDIWAQVLLLAIGTSHLACAINITAMEVRVPRVAYVGEDVELECFFPLLDPVYVYSVRWWRDNDQFYQFIPKNLEPKLRFDVKGINVDKPSSSEFKVTLRDLTLTSSGAFTCEVISDENFETFRKSANMTVIDPPDGSVDGYFGPVIEASGWIGVGPLEVSEDQRVEALCIAKRANPHVALSWYINGTKISKDDLQSETYHHEEEDVYTSKLLLVFSAEGLWDAQGRILLQCTADIPNLFHGSAVLEVHNPELRKTQLSGFLSDGSTLSTSWLLDVASTLISAHFQFIILNLRNI
ncbi:uncharacterized protein [Macrobrachium rosenbergii]|uniref:uncharacterized protein n=1 Tax=Macrobrachium rosenbergii TaxID=79674 RepID=UPI0034D50CF3